ncbi:MAG TPA: ABC transporter permease [Solirubrobacteraceae bacterium]|nr:ABC transporter permease [Solirubrobacteraceae bacterium]
MSAAPSTTSASSSGQAPSPPESNDPSDRLLKASRLTQTLRRPELGSVLGAVVVFVLFAITDATPNHLWLHTVGLAAWLQQAAFFGILAVPVGLLMIGGEFDLSTGVMSGATAILMALLVGKWGVNAWVAVVITVGFALVIGFINGYLVTRTKLPSFIVTLATFFVLRGVSVGGVQLLNNGSTIVSVTRPHPAGMTSLHTLFGSSFLKSPSLYNGFSTAILWFIAVTLLGTWVLAKTRFGNWIFASGGDDNAARNTGVPVARTKIILFLSTAVAAALVGVISFAQANSAVSEQGVGYEFYYIIAAVVGGCLLTGGYGSAIGAAIGACIIGMAFEGVIYAGWDSSWNFTFLGVILFLAVIINTAIYRRAQKARK